MYGVKFTLTRLAFALLLFVSVNVLGENVGVVVHHRAKRAIPLQISNKRIQLLEDALGWMNFRKNGQLMKKEEVATLFLNTLKQRYIDSKFFRTFVIAFEHGVVPRLTLNENEECDSDYTWRYKDPFGVSTWHFQKEFNFKNYKERKSATYKLCDYRQGLICKPASNKCGCPEGSRMQEISPGSPVKRCLLEENEICSLIDIDHGVDPNHKALADNLHQIIFNLEKPLSCKHGTQCRFKSPDISFPRCYKVNGGPWAPPYLDKFGNMMETWNVSYGEECVLGLIASPGSCLRLQWHSPVRLGSFDGYTCFNFGPPRSKISSGGAVPESRTGFCAHDYGPYGIAGSWGQTGNLIHYIPLFSPFVTPRTVPLRGGELETFFRDFIKVPEYFQSGSSLLIQESSEGAKCSVKKTKIWEETWSYFASLENDPPPGQDYVPQATKTELYANLQRAIDMTKNLEEKVCRIYGPYDSGNHIHIVNGVLQDQDRKPTLKCVGRGWSDKAGNDGTCQTPGNLDTFAFDERFEKFRHHIENVKDGHYGEKWYFDREILIDYPDGVCLPALEPLGKGRSLGDVYEGGFCSDGYVCYTDYSDIGSKYDEHCNLQSPSKKLKHVCHQSGDDVKYSKCEDHWQDKALSKELEKMSDTILGRGEKCAYDIESSIREKIERTLNHGYWNEHANKYKILHWLEKTRLSGGLDGGLCDRTKLLECNNQSLSCECVENTQPRRVTVDGVEYQSDYCYIATGNCRMNPTETFVEPSWDRQPLPLTEVEKEKIWKHYSQPTHWYACDGTNLCVALEQHYYRECITNISSGFTGYDLQPGPTSTTTELPSSSTTTTEPNFASVGGGRGPRKPGWRIGGGSSLRTNEQLTGSLAIAIIFIFTIYN